MCSYYVYFVSYANLTYHTIPDAIAKLYKQIDWTKFKSDDDDEDDE